MRVLWLSGKVLSEKDGGETGTWLEAMAQGLINTDQVALGNITEGRVKSLSRQDYGHVQQWIIPTSSRLPLDGSHYSKTFLSTIDMMKDFSPDLVHVWGTESNWGLLTARKPMDLPVLLEMQGLRGAISRMFHGGLSFREQLACVGLKEILLRSTIFQDRKRFEAWGAVDQDIIKMHRFISCHSDWIVAQVKAINKNAIIFRNGRVLRNLFYDHVHWRFTGNPVIFCSAAYHSPFKGLHVAIRSLAILRDRFPRVQMRIAGLHQRVGFRQDGYISWLNKEIHRLNLESNITWLGPLSGSQIVDELSNCSAVVFPTFIESYCVALAEAMVLGVPTVVSFTGGTSYLASDNETALFFPPGDETMCAYQLERLLINKPLAENISNNARAIAIVRNDPNEIIQNQIKIYHNVMAEARASGRRKN